MSATASRITKILVELSPDSEKYENKNSKVEFSRRLLYVRAHLVVEKGFLIPNPRVSINPELPQQTYRVVMGEHSFSGPLPLTHSLGVFPPKKLGCFDHSRGKVPGTNLIGIWVPCKERKKAQFRKGVFFNPLDLMALHLKYKAREHGHLFIDQNDILRRDHWLGRDLTSEELFYVTKVVKNLYHSGFTNPFLQPVLKTIVDYLPKKLSVEECSRKLISQHAQRAESQDQESSAAAELLATLQEIHSQFCCHSYDRPHVYARADIRKLVKGLAKAVPPDQVRRSQFLVNFVRIAADLIDDEQEGPFPFSRDEIQIRISPDETERDLLSQEIGRLRRTLRDDIGLVLPHVRVGEDVTLPKGTFYLDIQGRTSPLLKLAPESVFQHLKSALVEEFPQFPDRERQLLGELEVQEPEYARLLQELCPFPFIQDIFGRFLADNQAPERIRESIPLEPVIHHELNALTLWLGSDLVGESEAFLQLQERLQKKVGSRGWAALKKVELRRDGTLRPRSFRLQSGSETSLRGRIPNNRLLALGSAEVLEFIGPPQGNRGLFDSGLRFYWITPQDKERALELELLLLTPAGALNLVTLLEQTRNFQSRSVPHLGSLLCQLVVNTPPNPSQRELAELCLKGALARKVDAFLISLSRYRVSVSLIERLEKLLNRAEAFQATNFVLTYLKPQPESLRSLILRGGLEQQRGREKVALRYWQRAQERHCGKALQRFIPALLMAKAYKGLGDPLKALCILDPFQEVHKKWPKEAQEKFHDAYLGALTQSCQLHKLYEIWKQWGSGKVDHPWRAPMLQSGDERFAPLIRELVEAENCTMNTFDQVRDHWLMLDDIKEAQRVQQIKQKAHRLTLPLKSLEALARGEWLEYLEQSAHAEAGRNAEKWWTSGAQALARQRCPQQARRLNHAFESDKKRYHMISSHLERQDLKLCDLNGDYPSPSTLRPCVLPAPGFEQDYWLERATAKAQSVAEFHQREFGRWQEPLHIEKPAWLDSQEIKSWPVLGLWNWEASVGWEETDCTALVLHPRVPNIQGSAGFGSRRVASYLWCDSLSCDEVAIHEFYHSALNLEHSNSPHCIMRPVHRRHPRLSYVNLLQKAMCLMPPGAVEAMENIESSYDQGRDWESVLFWSQRAMEIHPFFREAHEQALQALEQLGRRAERDELYRTSRWKFGALLSTPAEPRTTALGANFDWVTYGSPRWQLRLTKEPEFFYDQVSRGLAHLRLGHFSRALECLELVESIAPFSVFSALYRFEVHHNQGETKKAEKAWSQVLRRGGTLFRWSDSVLQALSHAGDWDRLDAVLVQVAKQDRTEEHRQGTHFWRGIAHWGRGRWADAASEFSQSGKRGRTWLPYVQGVPAEEILKAPPADCQVDFLMAGLCPDSRWERRMKKCYPAAWKRLVRR